MMRVCMRCMIGMRCMWLSKQHISFRPYSSHTRGKSICSLGMTYFMHRCGYTKLFSPMLQGEPWLVQSIFISNRQRPPIYNID